MGIETQVIDDDEDEDENENGDDDDDDNIATTTLSYDDRHVHVCWVQTRLSDSALGMEHAASFVGGRYTHFMHCIVTLCIQSHRTACINLCTSFTYLRHGQSMACKPRMASEVCLCCPRTFSLAVLDVLR